MSALSPRATDAQVVRYRRAKALICPTSKAKTAHACHAQIARRANLSQAFWIAEISKSAASSALSRLDTRGVRVVTNVGRDAMDANAHA
jgi:hypothetical protein